MGEGDAEGMGPVGVGSASSPFGRAMMDMVNHDTLKDIAETQERMLKRFEKTNEKLDSFNEVASARLQVAAANFARHTALMHEARRDLQSVFRRIRTLKARLTERYPEGFNAVQAGKTTTRPQPLSMDDNGDDDESASTPHAGSVGGGDSDGPLIEPQPGTPKPDGGIAF
eukprot:m.72850 g.72850  ORF g.72850 m.72850 type:complete len:170 (-) comp8804_c0_seq2:90-599(-)